jgi:hypothetical protein
MPYLTALLGALCLAAARSNNINEDFVHTTPFGSSFRSEFKVGTLLYFSSRYWSV